MGAENILMTCYIVPSFRCSKTEFNILHNVIEYWIGSTGATSWQAIGLKDLEKGAMPESCLRDVPEGIRKSCGTELSELADMASTDKGVYVVLRGEEFRGLEYAVAFLRWKLKETERHNRCDPLVVHAYFDGQDWDDLDISDDAWIPEGCDPPGDEIKP